MNTPLPPVSDLEKFKKQVALVPSSMREDALQEAWVAHLEGGDPMAAIWRYAKNELRHRRAHLSIASRDGETPYVVDRKGKRTELTELTVSRQSKSALFIRRDSLAKAA